MYTSFPDIVHVLMCKLKNLPKQKPCWPFYNKKYHCIILHNPPSICWKIGIAICWKANILCICE